MLQAREAHARTHTGTDRTVHNKTCRRVSSHACGAPQRGADAALNFPSPPHSHVPTARTPSTQPSRRDFNR